LFYYCPVSLSFGQKKEIKKAEKLFESGDVKGAADILTANATLFESADEKVTLQKSI
jgi:hypothetical protein